MIKSAGELATAAQDAYKRAITHLEKATKEDVDGRMRVELMNRAANAANVAAIFEVGASLVCALEGIELNLRKMAREAE